MSVAPLKSAAPVGAAAAPKPVAGAVPSGSIAGAIKPAAAAPPVGVAAAGVPANHHAHSQSVGGKPVAASQPVAPAAGAAAAVRVNGVPAAAAVPAPAAAAKPNHAVAPAAFPAAAGVPAAAGSGAAAAKPAAPTQMTAAEAARNEKEGGAGNAVAAVKPANMDAARQKKEDELIMKWNHDMKVQEQAMYALPNKSKYKTFILSDAVFEVEQRYEIKEIVGHGAYGIVCSARDLKTGQLVAVKKIENIFEHRSLAKRTLRELKLTRYFYHENIMGIERVMRPHSPNFNNIYMVTELMETDLACVIRSPQELTDEHCQFFIYQVLRGLKYIHSANVIHRDLKPRNLLVNSNCDLKICDFGLARVDDPENADRTVLSNYIATRWYRAPEVILSRKRYSKAVDLWSVGCILAELLGRKPLFPGRDSFHQITLIVSILGTPEAKSVKGKKSRDYVAALPKKPKIPFHKIFPKASPLACDLLDKLLQFEPENRYTVEQALRHPYLEELHCEEDEPVCENFDHMDFYFEYLRTTTKDLRVLIHQEVVNNYKEDDYECKDPTPSINDFAAQLKKDPKNAGKRRRRKSF